jgi:RNA polymerase sigma-70 factor (sigma-E family)
MEPNGSVTGLDRWPGTSGGVGDQERRMAMTLPRAPGGTSDRDAREPAIDAVMASPGFAPFYREAWPGAVRLAGLLTQDARIAEDVAQDAFARVYAQWSRVESPNAYLRAAIVNACKSWQSRRHTERTKLPLVATPGSTELAFDLLADAVAALPYRQRAVLVLRYYAGLREADIADALGCRPGTVKSLTSRALAALRKGIEQ